MADNSTNWVTLLAGNERGGGTSAARAKGPEDLIWKATLEPIRSSPVLHAGVLYVTSRDGHLHAFESGTGKERWKFQTGSPVHSTPSISGDLILFGADDGATYALDRTSGQLRWRAEGGRPIWSSPVV